MGCSSSRGAAATPPAQGILVETVRREPCCFGAACTERDGAHRGSFSHPGDPDYPPRTACKKGEDCHEKAQAVHCARFSHPGDPDYRGPRKMCQFGAGCTDKGERHILRFVHPGDPDHRLRKACRFGLKCFRKSDEHVVEFSHPGDADYRRGCVAFEDGAGPEFETLRQLFDFCDPSSHGNFASKEDLQHALRLLAAYRPDGAVDVDLAWRELVGDRRNFVGFATFATWAQQIGATLPTGVTVNNESNMSCGFRYPDGRLCGCKSFADADSSLQPTDSRCSRQSSSRVRLCTCGHKRSMHAWRSESKDGHVLASDMAPAPAYWPERPSLRDPVLVELGGEAMQAFQRLLDATHKADDNWTRDRGCSFHGRSCHTTDAACAFKHKCQVPTGYRVVAVMRNMNPELWAYYAINRGAIAEECAGQSGTPFKPILDVETLKVLLEDAPLVQSCNEWFLFHGTSPGNCMNICRTNFKVSLAGAGATWKGEHASKGAPLYGYGLYFAERITKADEYSDMVEAGNPYAGAHTVLVSRVLGGRTQCCDTNEIDPAFLQKQVISGPFHSVFGDRVSKLRKPYREVVVYDATQCYPEYIVYYRRLYS